MPSRHHAPAAIVTSAVALTLTLAAAGPSPSADGTRPHGKAVRAPRAQPAAARLAPVLWIEPVPGGRSRAGLPLYAPIPASDARRATCDRLVRNEPADFMRTLVAWAWGRYGGPASWTERVVPLVIALKEGGNNAARGFALKTDEGVVEHGDMPFILLEPTAASLSDTLLHEGGHLLHVIATRGRRPAPPWTAVPHTTFAVTDPLTALSEGFAIHLETMLGHYVKDPSRRAYYHRLSPGFDLRASRDEEYFAPIRDLMTFSQSWARYQAVRETLPAFAGHVYVDQYLRSQFDPQRDRETLKTGNGMIASEGVVASALFWTAVGLAAEEGARPGLGLDQAGVLKAEQALLGAFAALPAPEATAFRPDVTDLIAALGPGSPAYRLAVSRFVDVTRGVTARPSLRAEWRRLYRMAIDLDIAQGKALLNQVDAARSEVLDAAFADPAVLRAGLGPVIPVRAANVSLLLKAFGEPFPLQFDLNAATRAELAAVPGLDDPARDRVLELLDRGPFASLGDFENRARIKAAAVGITAAPR